MAASLVITVALLPRTCQALHHLCRQSRWRRDPGATGGNDVRQVACRRRRQPPQLLLGVRHSRQRLCSRTRPASSASDCKASDPTQRRRRRSSNTGPDRQPDGACAEGAVHLLHQLLRQRWVGGAVQNRHIQQLGYAQHPAAGEGRAAARPPLSAAGAAEQSTTCQSILDEQIG